jgi:hypothetical protein
MPSIHSAIVNPDPSPKDASYITRLNENGLFDDAQAASELMDSANATGHLLSMFCVLDVRVELA